MFNQPILNEITIYSPQGEKLLSIDKATANIEILPLLDGNIEINSIQLFGMDASVRRETPDSPLNLQFLIDKLKPSDKRENKNFI